MGCKWILYMLNHVDNDWKEKYIDQWISLSPAYGGSPKILKTLATGEGDDVPFLKSLKVRNI